MTRNHKTVSSLQGQLRSDIIESIQNDVADVAIKTVQEHLNQSVYQAYIPKGEYAYDRTFELLNSVTVGNVKMGNKFVYFDIFMDTEKIGSYVKEGNAEWNQHASVEGMDVSEYIPLWTEEGTDGSLWDREGAHYMEQSWIELDSGKLAHEFANRLRQKGWNVVRD
ncbi:hypothetical protein MOC30_13995 [Bacillus spizizenii]|nr:hypothetical protein [Bacillus spizizenii]